LSDPVSWLVIDRGWAVVDAAGDDVGKVEETVGDSNRDIFNGLTVATGLLHKAKYVPAESVAEITDGQVRLSIGRDAFERLGSYEEPPPSERIVAP
jgi:uncharacterized protein YrrD